MPRPRIHPRRTQASLSGHRGQGRFRRQLQRLRRAVCTQEGPPSRPLHRSHLCAVAFTFPAAGNSTISMTPNGQATMQDLQPMHFSSSTCTLSFTANGIIRAAAGTGALSQCRHVIALRFCSCFITVMRGKKRCGVRTCCSSLCAITQATSQALQPMHLRLSLIIKWFMVSFGLR